MRNCLLLLVVGFLLQSCNAGCVTEEAISSGLAGSVKNLLNCTNEAAIQADIKLVMNHTNICAAPPVNNKTGVVANIVCPVVASTAVLYLGKQIPASWGCTPTAATSDVKALITTACEMLPI